MRIWSGFSFVFFTLNPDEWGSPLTLTFMSPYYEAKRHFSLDLSDAEMQEFYGKLRREECMHLLRRSIQDPDASTEAFWALLEVV